MRRPRPLPADADQRHEVAGVSSSGSPAEGRVFYFAGFTTRESARLTFQACQRKSVVENLSFSMLDVTIGPAERLHPVAS